jgi:hypothetical protein
MVVCFWSYPSILKACCCVCMLLPVLLNDCVTFSGVLELLLDQNRLVFHFCRLSLSLVVIIIMFPLFWCFSSHLELSSSIGMLLMVGMFIDCDCFLGLWRYFSSFFRRRVVVDVVVVVISSCFKVYCCLYCFFRIQPWDCFLLLFATFEPLRRPPRCCPCCFDSCFLYFEFLWLLYRFLI